MDAPQHSTGPLRWLNRLDRVVEGFERFILAFGVILMAIMSIANVIGRNLFDHSLDFAGEINQLLIIMITFVGIGYGVRHARHIRMSAVYDQLKGVPRKLLMVLIAAGTSVLMFTLCWYAIGYVEKVHRIGSVTPALQVPLYLFYVWVPLGFFLGGVQYLLATIRNLTTPGIHLSFQQPEAYEDPGQTEGY